MSPVLFLLLLSFPCFLCSEFSEIQHRASMQGWALEVLLFKFVFKVTMIVMHMHIYFRYLHYSTIITLVSMFEYLGTYM